MRKHSKFVSISTLLLFASLCQAQPHDEFTEKSGFSLEAQQHIEQGNLLFDSGDFEQAAITFGKAAQAGASHSDAYYNQGLCFFQTGDYAKAEQALDRLIEANPSDTAAYELYGLTLYHRQHFDRAIAAFNVSLAARQTADLHVAKALAYVSTGRSKQALLSFDDALRLNPNSFSACLGKGTALVELGQCQLATVWLDKALAIKPDDATALSNRGIAKFKSGDKTGAMEDFRLAVLAGRASGSYLARARCYVAEGNFTEAAYDVQEALLLGDGNPDTYCLLGEIQEGRGQYAAAADSYAKALAQKPGHAPYVLKRCGAMVKNNLCYEAIQEIYRLLDSDPLNAEARQLMQAAYDKIDAQLAGNGL